MKSTWRIGSVRGIALDVHASWLFALVLVTMSLTGELRSAGRFAPLAAFVTSLFFFASIVLHELAHAEVARRRAVPVESITLFVFGGVAALKREPARPRDELAIAAAGPLASAAIGALAWALSRAPVMHPLVGEALAWIGRVNLGLALFNVLPGFPLDGGRMLRALLWARGGDPTRATLAAARVSRAIAAALMGLGVLSALGGGLVNGLWTVFLGWFLRSAADEAALDARLRAGGAHAGSAVSVDYPIVSATMSVERYVEDVLFGTGHGCHLVLSDGGAPLGPRTGVVTFERVAAVPRDAWRTTAVGAIARPVEELPAVGPHAGIFELAAALGDAPLVVVREGDEVMGIVDRDRLLAIVRAHAALDALASAGPPAGRSRRAAPAGLGASRPLGVTS